AFVSSGDLMSAGDANNTVSASRSVESFYLEAVVPILHGIEAQLAARYDHYSDFGSTTNPKVALRWQPVKSLLLRGSWGTGFRAPTLYDLYTPQLVGFADDVADPVRCPVTDTDTDCNGPFRTRGGANPNLKPETSHQVNAGLVMEPLRALSLSVDYWQIVKQHAIGNIADFGQVLDPANYARLAAGRVIRGPADPAHPDLPGPIQEIILINENLGELRTSGIDVAMSWRDIRTRIGTFALSVDGTYVLTWEQQLPASADFLSGAGRNQSAIGPIARWKHYASFNWAYGVWSATLAQTFQTGYQDRNEFPPFVANPEFRRVAPYQVWDLQGTYKGIVRATISLGVKNLFDRTPPLTNAASFQVGYDPHYADPRGRTYYARASYAFH